MNIYDYTKLINLDTPPTGKEELNDWMKQQDVIKFLEEDLEDDNIIIYAGLQNSFIYSIFIPQVDINEEIVDELFGWSCNPTNQWSYVLTSKDIWIEGPLSGKGCSLIKNGEQILFSRCFEGVSSRHHYYEINQKLAQVLELHFMPEREAWCKLDENGDIKNIIGVLNLQELAGYFKPTLIYMEKKLVEEYASVNNYSLIRFFDFTRTYEGFMGWVGKKTENDLSNQNGIYGHFTCHEGDGSYSRGFQLVHFPQQIKEPFIQLFGRTDKQYTTFLAVDWRHNKTIETSCDPASISSYFDDSDFPFQTSPVFFNPQVLSKYKSDREKYALDASTISCRGTWYIQRFGVNEASQVFTYLGYLGNLPYSEQLYWKSFNEKPISGLPQHVIKTDFNGQWVDYYDPLQAVKRKLSSLTKDNVDWWKLRSEELSTKVQYPYSTSKDDWAEEILNLHQLLIEGLSEKWLKQKAIGLGGTPKAKFGSLKLLESCLVGLGFDEDRAYDIMTPFQKLNDLRIIKAHVSQTKAEELRINAIKEFKSYYAHFSNLCRELDESLDLIIEAFQTEKTNDNLIVG